MSLGQIIRSQREKLKLTLDEVSRRTGYSKPYLSTIENDKVKNPPADELLLRLEELLDFERCTLVHIAHLQKLPADVREAFEANQAELARWKQLVQRIVDQGGRLDGLRDHPLLRELFASKTALNNTRALPTAGRLVPIINRVAAGYPMDYNDKDYPPGIADDYVRCPDLHDPHAFAVTVVGDSMEPKYHEGDIVIFSPERNVDSGDDCFVRMADPHETTFKQVFFEQSGQVRLQPRNHQYAPLMLEKQRVTGIYLAVSRYEKMR